MAKSGFLSLAAIASIPFIVTLGNSMLIPVLPVMEHELGISTFQSSLIITVYSIVAVVFIPLAGIASDRVGRKNVIIPSLAITGAGGLISALATILAVHPFYFILAGRFIQGIGAAGAFPIVFPLMGDLFSDEEDVSHGLGIAETANTLGKVISPILGTLFAALAWYVPFFTIPILSLLSLLMIAFWIDDSKAKKKTMAISSFFKLLKDVFKEEGKWLTAVFLSGIVIMTNLFGLLVYLSKILEDSYRIVGIKKGLALAIPLVSIALSSYLAGKFIGKEKTIMRRTTLIGFLLVATACFAMVFFHELWSLFAFISVAGVGFGISLPSLDAIITESIEKEHRGTITSVYSGMRYAGVAIGPPLFSVLLLYSVESIFLVASGLSLMAAILVFTLIRPPTE